MALPLQRIEGKYEILRKLGEGGMGAVYMVRHRLLDEIRVIKVMRPQLESDEENRHRFMREAKMAIKLRHPNIAQLYDFTIDEDGTAFIVLEYIKGLTLDELLKKSGPPPVPVTLEIAIQSLKALGYLHKRGFVHRDISPDNLMLSQDFEGQPLVKLIDLGIAKVLEGEGNLTATGMFLGKIRYSAPEQFEADVGSSHADARCDLYSFGMVLYELCTGCSPISGEKPSAIIAGHLFRPPLAFEESDPQGRVPENLRGIILKALEKKAEDRIQSAQDFSRQLREVQKQVGDGTDLGGTTILPALEAVHQDTDGKTPGTTQNSLDLQFGMGSMPSGPTVRTPAGADRATRLDPAVQTPGRGPKDRIATLLAGAEKLAQLAQYQDAKLQLDIVLDIDPNNSSAHDLALTVQEALDKVAVQRQREALERIAADIEAHLATGELVKAEAELHRARTEFGDDPHLTGLNRRLEMLQDRARRARVAELVSEAEGLRDEGQLQEAVDRLGTAELIDEGNSKVVALLEAVQELLQRQQALGVVIASLTEQLDGGDLDGAEQELESAVRDFPDAPELEPLQRRLVAGRREQEQARRREASQELERGRVALEADDPATALEALAKALALTPDDRVALELQRQAQERQKEVEEAARRQGRIEKAATAIEKQLGAGRLARAGSVLEKARAAEGEAPELAELAGRLAMALREREEAERAAAEAARIDDLLKKAGKEAKADRAEEALQLAEEVLAARPEDQKAQQIADAARQEIQRREEQAQREREEAERAAAEAERLAQLLGQARLAHSAGNHEEALRLAEQVIAGRPQDADARRIAESSRQEIDRQEAQARSEAEKAERAAAEAERLGQLLEQARGLLEAERFPEALQLVEQLLGDRPGDPEAEQIAERCRAEIARIEKEAELQAAVEAARVEILARLEAGELDEAETALQQAAQIAASEDPFSALQSRLDRARAQEQRARIKELLATSGEQLAANRSILAIREARAALALDSSSRDAQRVLARAEKVLGLGELSPTEREPVEAAADAIEAQLAGSDLVAVEHSIYQAREAHGEAPWLRELQKQLEKLERAARSDQVKELLEAARASFEAEQLSAAQESVEKILLIDSAHRAAQELKKEIEKLDASRRASEDAEQAVVDAVRSIGSLLDAGKAEQALKDVQEALRQHGENEALRRLRERAAQTLLERERLDDTGGGPVGVTTVLPAEPAFPDGATTVMPAPPSDATTVLPKDEAVAPPRVEPKPARRRPAPKQVDTLKVRPAEVADAMARAGARTPRSPWADPKRWGPIAAVVLLIVAIGVWYSSREPAPPAVARGVLVVDALPWARVDQVSDSEGQTVEIGAERETPLYLDLPAGSYILELTGPGGESRQVQIEIEAGASSRHVEEIRAVDADGYFQEAGW